MLANAKPPSAAIVGEKLFFKRPLVIWAAEWHMTPIKDLRNILEPFGVRFLDYNLDPWRCEWHDCRMKEKLRVLTSDNVLNIDPPIPSRFYETYKDDPEMKRVDVIFCGYPASLCEMFEPFNKSVLILASTRYDVGRYTPERWNTLNEKLRRFATKPQNVIGGNNLYDARYIEYYTGIKTRHMQSICDYTDASYNPIIPKYLVLRRRDKGFNPIFFNEFEAACAAIDCRAQLTLMEGYSYQELANHFGIVHVPYQISVMSIFEQYRMNIPQFFPTLDLLTNWQLNHFIMPERTFDGAWFDQRPYGSIIPRHESQDGVPDPKNEHDRDALRYWIKYVDFYQIMPHVIYFNSTTHLARILKEITSEELMSISKKMEKHNIQMKKDMLTQWKEILINYAKASPNHLY